MLPENEFDIGTELGIDEVIEPEVIEPEVVEEIAGEGESVGEGEDVDADGGEAVVENIVEEVKNVEVDTDLREEIARLSRELEEARSAVPPKVEGEQAPKPKSLQFVLSDDEFSDALASKEAFNEMLNRVHEAGRQSYLQEAPRLVQVQLMQQKSADAYAAEFYKVNKDLKPYEQVVGTVASDLIRTIPGLTHQELFEKVATETRRRLNLKSDASSANNSVKDTKRKPGLPGARSSRVGAGTANTGFDFNKELF
jgi:hypothetical protein